MKTGKAFSLYEINGCIFLLNISVQKALDLFWSRQVGFLVKEPAHDAFTCIQQIFYLTLEYRYVIREKSEIGETLTKQIIDAINYYIKKN